MTEYLICRPEYTRKTRFIPAHLTYKIENGHLYREQIPISLNGGVMVVGKISGELNLNLAKRILTECLRFSFTGVLLALSPIPDENDSAFARDIANLLSPKKIKLFLPMTYSSCTYAHLLIPAISTSKSFSDYLNELCALYSPTRLSVEFSSQPMEFVIPQKEANLGVPISFERLRELLDKSGAMTFYSPDLCSNYFTCGSSFIVYDTPETLSIKKEVAKKLGLDSCFYLVSPKNATMLEKLEETL